MRVLEGGAQLDEARGNLEEAVSRTVTLELKKKGGNCVSSKVDRLLREIEDLEPREFRELLERMSDKTELLGWLKVSESAFADWDNPEDAVCGGRVQVPPGS